jgi:hypothetical protein
MKLWLVIAIAAFCVVLNGITDPTWQSFQRDIGIQAAAYQNSPEHQAYKQTRDTRNYNVGDTKTFWRWNLAVMPPTWVQTPSTCRAVGEHCYVFVADSEWNSHITQANVDTIMVRLEQNTPNNADQGAIAMDISLFGPIPDELDNDPKLIVFYSALGSFQGTSFDGYFSAYNQVTEAQAQQMNPSGHSNECEMIYMTCYPLSPIAPIRLSVLAHELEHLIHWGQDANEQSWLDEGCAELAMVAYGVPDPISGFNSNPDNDLTAWNQTTADYVKVMLFFTYLQEHYDQNGLISALIADPANGMPSLEAQVNLQFPDFSTGQILRNWNVANAIDEAQPGEGLYNYTQLNIPNFTMTSVNQNPTLTNQTVSAYAADYLSYLMPVQTQSFSLQANMPVYVSAILFDATGNCTEVIDGNLVSNIDFNPLPSAATRIVIVISNPNANQVTYSYSVTPVANDDLIQSPVTALSCYPNPFHIGDSAINISITNLLHKVNHDNLEIYNIKGQIVRKLALQPEAETTLLKASWDGRKSNNQPVANGIYLLRYANGREQLSKKLIISR